MADLRTRDVAAELQTSPETVRGLIASGDLRAYRLRGAHGPWRITPEAVQEYRDRQQARRQDPWVRTRARRRAS